MRHHIAFVSVQLITLLTLMSGARWCAAEEDLAAGDRRLLLRISRDAIGDIQQQEFKSERNVSDTMLGTKIKGISKTSAKCALEPCEVGAMSSLRLVVTGTSVTDTEGRNGPAIIESTTTTEFTATAPLHFSPEDGFTAGEVKVDADSKTKTNKVRSSQGGIAGSFVKKFAEKKIKESLPEAQKLSRELAIKRISSEVAAELKTRLEKVNATYARMAPVIAAANASENQPVHLLAHNGDIVVSLGSDKKPNVEKLPQLTTAAEVWLPTQPVEANVAQSSNSSTDKPTLVANVIQRQSDKALADKPQPRSKWWIVRSDDQADALVAQ
jgi:hypothetical protein